MFLILGVLRRIRGVLHRVLGALPRVLGVLHRVRGGLHMMLRVLHRALEVLHGSWTDGWRLARGGREGVKHCARILGCRCRGEWLGFLHPKVELAKQKHTRNLSHCIVEGSGVARVQECPLSQDLLQMVHIKDLAIHSLSPRPHLPTLLKGGREANCLTQNQTQAKQRKVCRALANHRTGSQTWCQAQ